MSQWKSYDILIQCVVHLSTCVYCSFQDWFQFPLRISIMSTALERWNLNASEFFVLVFAVFVFCFHSCSLVGVPACQIGKVVVVLLWAANMSAIPEFQAFSLSRDQSLHPDNTEKTPKRAGVLVQIQNWVSSVWKEEISSKVNAAASADMLLRSHEFSLGVCPSHVRATLVRATYPCQSYPCVVYSVTYQCHTDRAQQLLNASTLSIRKKLGTNTKRTTTTNIYKTIWILQINHPRQLQLYVSNSLHWHV